MSSSAIRIGVFTSGRGGLLGHLIDKMQSDSFLVEAVVADRDCDALKTATSRGIPAQIIRDPKDSNSYLGAFTSFNLDAIVFAGFLSIMPPEACVALHGRVINSHPALLPKFGGPGYFGLRVHDEVLRSGDRNTGCTVHLVSPKIDEGQIIAQRSTAVRSGETSWELARRVHELEKELLLEVLVNWPRENKHG